MIPRPPGDGGFLFQIPRGTPGRGILKLRIPRSPRGGGFFKATGDGISTSVPIPLTYIVIPTLNRKTYLFMSFFIIIYLHGSFNFLILQFFEHES